MYIRKQNNAEMISLGQSKTNPNPSANKGKKRGGKIGNIKNQYLEAIWLEPLFVRPRPRIVLPPSIGGCNGNKKIK